MNKYIFGLLVIITTALMGSSFAIGKLGLVYSSPLLLAAYRFSLAGIIMALFVRALKRPHPKTTNSWIRIFIIGFFQTTGVMGCIFMSLRTITAGESSILTFLNPLLVVVIGTVFLKIKYNNIQWLGVILGFVGVFITMGGHLELRIGTLFGFVSAISWAVGTILAKTWGQQFDTWVLSAYQMLFGGIVLFGCSFLFENPALIFSFNFLFILSWLVIMSSIVQFAVWYYLLQKGDPGKTSAYLFLAPFFGVVSGWLILEERLESYIILGGLFIVGGIILVNGNFYRIKSVKNDITF